ncbi:MAG TPA: acyltransferase [Patescibacteria group bacterium]|nr:acyltransferase [Patescibacteria group bacterium]
MQNAKSQSKKKKSNPVVRKGVKKKKSDFFIHPTAIVEDNVQIGRDTKIWHFSQIRSGTKIGQNCVIGNSVFIDFDSIIGDNVKIQNRAIIYHQAIIESGVFIGPNVCFTNDKIPRAINADGKIKSADDWEVSTIEIGEGASIGGHTVILPGVKIGKFALIGAGAVITKDTPPHALVYGNPGRIYDFVCFCGQRLKEEVSRKDNKIIFQCVCGLKNIVLKMDYDLKFYPPAEEKPKIWLR